MASTIQIKNSTTSGNSPSSLATGELAINVVDGNFFYGSASAVKQDFALGNLTASNTIISGTLSIEGSGSTLFEVVGSEGQLFSITDSLSGSLFAVSDVSGLPILEVFSDDTVKIGTFNNEGIIVGGTNVTASGNVDIQGILSIPGFTDVSASLAAAVAGGDDLGNHTASLDLNMGGNAITNVGNVDGVDVSALNSTVSTNTSNIATLTAATSSYLTSVPAGTISSSAQITITESQISDLTHYTDSDVKTKLNTEGVISSSTQVDHNATTNFNAAEHFTQANITTVGTIGTGVWQGTAIADGYISSATTWNNKLDSAGTIVTDDYANIDASAHLTGRSYSEVKTDLSLNNVENTALSTWAGSSNITTLGTITTGTWQGSPISTTYISNLSGTNTGDQDLTPYSTIVQLNASSSALQNNINTNTSNISNIASFTASLDPDITTLSLPASTTISAFGKTLVDDADASAARTTLGVDAAGTDNSTNVTLAGTPDYITITGQVITRNQIDLTTDVTGQLPAANLGTITSAKISDVDAFSQTGIYASLRAQGTTAGDVGLGNVTNESKATMFTSPTFTGTVAIPGFADVSASLAAAVAGGDNLGNHTATQNLNMGGFAITSVGNVDGVDVSALNSTVSTNTSNISSIASFTASLDPDITTLSLPASTTISAFGKTLVDDADASAARTTLGLGTAATTAIGEYVNINGDILEGDLDFDSSNNYNIINVGELRATTVSGSTFVSDGVTVVSTPDVQTVKIGQSAGGSGPMKVSIVSSNTQYGLFSNTGIELTGSVGISSTLSIPGFADVSASLAAAGTVNTTGTPANNQLAIFTDSNTIEGDSNLTWTGNTLNVGSNGDIAKFVASNIITFNGANDDQSFQVKGSGDDNLLQVNPQYNDRVGIGTSTPSEKLTVVGAISSSGYVYGDRFYLGGDLTKPVGLYHAASNTIRLAGTSTNTLLQGTNVQVTAPFTASGNVDIQGILSLPGFSNVSASLAAAVAGGDNLGNHTATTTLNLDSNDITNVGIIKIGNGSVSAPSLAFTNDTNTGIYSIAPDTMGIVSGGSSKINVGSTVGVLAPFTVTDDTDNTYTTLVTINNTNTGAAMSSNQYSLKVNGGAAYGAPGTQIKSYGGYFTAGDTNAANPDSVALYAQGHEDGAPNSYAALFSGSAGGVVGINTMEPTVELEVSGDVKVSGTLEIGGIADVSASIAAASGGGAATTYRVALVSNSSLGQTTLRYLPFNSLSEQSSFNYLSIVPAAADGKLISITVWPQSGGGSSTMGLHINSNATAASTDTQTLSIGAPTTFTFSSGNTFSQNDELSFSIVSTSIPNGFSAQIILEYDY